MTKTAIKVRELDEQERHNKELERQGRVQTTLSGIANIGGAILKAFVPGGGLLSAAKNLLSGGALNEFAKLYQAKQSGQRLNSQDYAKYRDYVNQIKGGSK